MAFAPFGKYEHDTAFNSRGDRRLWPLSLIIPAILIAAIVTPLYVSANSVTGHGSHYGYVTAVDTGGVFFTTTTVHFKSDTQATISTEYCATDPAIIAKLNEYGDHHQRVKISYTTYFMWGPGCQQGGPTINSVEVT